MSTLDDLIAAIRAVADVASNPTVQIALGTEGSRIKNLAGRFEDTGEVWIHPSNTYHVLIEGIADFVDGHGVSTPNLAAVLAVGNAANAKITNLSEPTSNSDAATKYYVDTHSGIAPTLAVVLAAGNAANAKITNLTTPTNDYDAATKKYVDEHYSPCHDPATVSGDGIGIYGQNIFLYIGTGSDDVAAGDHLHTGVYDPAGTAAGAIFDHESAYDHSKIHDPATVSGDGIGIYGQDIFLYIGTGADDVAAGDHTHPLVPGGLVWITKSTTYTAVSGEGISADTSGGGWTLTLPATPSIGNTVGISDSDGTFDTDNLTIDRNGSLIQGIDEDLIVDLKDASFLLIYNGADTGWKLDTYLTQGVAIIGGGGSSPSIYTPPVVADLSWINQGSATASDITSDAEYPGLLLSAGYTATEDWKILYRTAGYPATPFTLTIGWRASAIIASYHSWGIVVLDASNKIICWVLEGNSLVYKRENSPTSWDSNSWSLAGSNGGEGFLSLRDDGANFLCSYGYDLNTMIQYYSQGRTAWLSAPAKIGIAVNANANYGTLAAKSLFFHWDLT